MSDWTLGYDHDEFPAIFEGTTMLFNSDGHSLSYETSRQLFTRIVRAVNAHDELVAALEALTSDAMLSTELPFAAAAAFHDARALLARIKGESK